MEDIEVGEYLRTNKGLITKITDIEIEKYEDGTSEIFIETELNPGYLDYTIKDIVKHSKQLIDLIEVGDIVRIRTGLYSSFMEFIDNEEYLLILKEQVKKFWTIEEILTKEIYMANCYKGGGEDE